MPSTARDAIRLAQAGLLLNAVLAVVKLLAGIVGHSYALIADGIESSADIFASLVVWGGLHIASQDADDDHPYGHGKAEALAAAVVGLMLLGAAVGIGIQSVREIITPHHAPAPFTLAVLVIVVFVKEVLFRRVVAHSQASGSTAVQADAFHHRADAITSIAAFLGIAVALAGGPGWESADDWAAIVAAGIICYNGVSVLRRAVDDLMDHRPDDSLLARVDAAAAAVEGVRATEKLHMRKVGTGYLVDLHVQADPALSLHEAHILSGRVKSAIRGAVPEVRGALIHMEPYEG